jgi:cytochrome bd-type quinol oxidase subunit 2
MLSAVILFLVPTLLFVLAFLYETYLSFRRLKKSAKASGASRVKYLSATWEVTHTLLVFAVIMLIMLFTKSLDALASAIFTSTFLAASALAIRAAAYIYIFYVRSTPKINWVDWVFAISHLVAATLLVVVVIQALLFIYQNNPAVNSQFLPFFLPGLALVLLICIVPLAVLYKTRN